MSAEEQSKAGRLSRDAGPAQVLESLSSLIARGVDACLATVVAIEGSSPSTPGQKLVVGRDGTLVGTVGGGAVEHEAVDRMRALIEAGGSEPEMRWYALAKDLAMACGGRVHLLFEPFPSATPVLLVGAGHIGSALAVMLPRLGFRVVLVDQREAAVAEDRRAQWPDVDARHGRPQDVANDVPQRAAVLVATHDHTLDEEAIVWALGRGFRYVGGVGSKSKAAKLRKRLQDQGTPQELIDGVRMPVGLKLGGRSPEEIALSIAAEIVAWRAGKLEAFIS